MHQSIQSGPSARGYLRARAALRLNHALQVAAIVWCACLPALAAADPNQLSGSTGFDDDLRWADDFNIASGCNGNVWAIAPATTGEIYLGGQFTSCGDIVARNIVRYDPGTDSFSPVGSSGHGVNRRVAAMVFLDGDLIVAGDFDQAEFGGPSPITVNHLARWDGVTWHSIGSGDGNGTNQHVRALTTSGTDLFVGGDFTVVNAGGTTPVTANRVARWTGSQWHALGSGGGNGVSGGPAIVEALTLDGSDLYVGGRFTQANAGAGIQADNVARWDGNDWHPLGHPASNGTDGHVMSLTMYDNELVIAGSFTQVFNGPSLELRNLARWDGTGWSRFGPGAFSGVTNGIASSLVVVGDDLVIAGTFQTAIDSSNTNAARIVLWDGSSFSALGGPGNGLENGVSAVAEHNGAIYVGGNFLRTVGGTLVPAGRIARFENGSWSNVGNVDGLGITGSIYTILTIPGGAYVGGRFSAAGGVPANNLAFWDGSSWFAVGSGGGNGTDGSVHALAVYDGALYVGGIFGNANVGNDIPANNLARWNGSTWSSVASGDGNGTSSWVYALAEYDGILYVGGHFTTVEFGGSTPVAANRIAGWNGSNWSIVGTNGGSGTNDLVRALTVYNDNLIIGGNFDRIDINGSTERTASHLAGWDGSDWFTLEGNGGEGVDNGVLALVVHDGGLAIGGLFSEANVGNPILANQIVNWNGTDFSELGSGGGNGVNSFVNDLAAFDGDLLVGGAFTASNIGGGQVATSGVARWTGSGWSALGSGTSAGPTRILSVIDGTHLLVGGDFGLAGGKPSAAIAAYYLVADDVFADRFE